MNILSPFRYIKSLFYPRISPLITVHIDEAALLHNLREYRQAYPDIQFSTVLKSNAYGHGLVSVAKVLDSQKLPFLILDSYYEALTLRQNAIKSPILIIGYILPEIIKKSQLKNIYFTVTTLAQLQVINDSIRRPISIHLKIDTGMHRQGLLPTEIHQAITIIKQNSFIQLQGICSHLSDADNKISKYNTSQLKK